MAFKERVPYNDDEPDGQKEFYMEPHIGYADNLLQGHTLANLVKKVLCLLVIPPAIAIVIHLVWVFFRFSGRWSEVFGWLVGAFFGFLAFIVINEYFNYLRRNLNFSRYPDYRPVDLNALLTAAIRYFAFVFVMPLVVQLIVWLVLGVVYPQGYSKTNLTNYFASLGAMWLFYQWAKHSAWGFHMRSVDDHVRGTRTYTVEEVQSRVYEEALAKRQNRN